MAKMILYIATSVDLCIARKNGDVSWLLNDQDYGYREFFNSVGAIILGRKTYDHIRTFGDYPYKGVQSYILTHHPELVTLPPDGSCYTGEVGTLVEKIKKESNKNIWVVGGAEVAQQCLREHVIDEIQLHIHPLLLGDGIRLFSHDHDEIKLALEHAKRHESGLVQLIYQVHYSTPQSIVT